MLTHSADGVLKSSRDADLASLKKCRCSLHRCCRQGREFGFRSSQYVCACSYRLKSFSVRSNFSDHSSCSFSFLSSCLSFSLSVFLSFFFLSVFLSFFFLSVFLSFFFLSVFLSFFFLSVFLSFFFLSVFLSFFFCDLSPCSYVLLILIFTTWKDRAR